MNDMEEYDKLIIEVVIQYKFSSHAWNKIEHIRDSSLESLRKHIKKEKSVFYQAHVEGMKSISNR